MCINIEVFIIIDWCCLHQISVKPLFRILTGGMGLTRHNIIILFLFIAVGHIFFQTANFKKAPQIYLFFNFIYITQSL